MKPSIVLRCRHCGSYVRAGRPRCGDDCRTPLAAEFTDHTVLRTSGDFAEVRVWEGA